MKKYLVILLSFVSLFAFADDWDPCSCADCPNPARGCKFTIDEGFVSRTFELNGKVRVTNNPSEADVCVYVSKYDADLVVTWVKEQPTYGCGQWHRVDNGEGFSICFVKDPCRATLTIRYGDAAKTYADDALPY